MPPTRSNESPHDVQALFDAALRQQLQGPPCAGVAQCAVSRDRGRHPARRKPHAGFSGEESERTGAAAGSRRRTLPRRVQRHPVVCRRRHAAGAGVAGRARRGAAVDVLRTARAGAQYRRRLFLAVAGQGRPRPADPCAGGLDGARLCRASGDGKPPQDPRLFRRRPAHRRRHRAVRLHPCRRPLRL